MDSAKSLRRQRFYVNVREFNGTFHACYPADPDTQIASDAPQKFTGKERDAETGLDFFLARYYSGAQGRFLSVDPDNTGASIKDPQSWNAYAYSRNNPLLYTDPTGTYYEICSIGGDCWYGFDNELRTKIRRWTSQTRQRTPTRRSSSLA